LKGKVVYDAEAEHLGIPWMTEDELPEVPKPKPCKRAPWRSIN
jgi:hypothetical protein